MQHLEEPPSGRSGVGLTALTILTIGAAANYLPSILVWLAH